VPHATLEEYCRARLCLFSRVFAKLLSPTSSEANVEAAFHKALQLSGGDEGDSQEQDCLLRFGHRCRFIGCMSKECNLCKNNPNKRCPEGDNLDECYADCQVLRSKCEAEVFVELVNTQTERPVALPGMEVQVSVIDGESWNEAQPSNTSRVRELLKSDEGLPLLSCSMPGHRVHPSGRIILKLQNGLVKLPDVSVTDKNDTFHLMGTSFGSFRLMARAVKRDLFGNLQLVESIPPAVTGKFIVKTQRAISDYRKCEYPHYKDELTKLKFVGNITAQRLRDIQAHLGPDAPFSSITTVEQMKHLILYADQNRAIENKLLDLLNMKGKHKHKWVYLHNILLERVVYDDQAHRAWYADVNMTQGLVYACKQAQVSFDKPLGLLQRTQQGMQTVLQVYTQPEGMAAETLRAWRTTAENAWVQPGHPGWTTVTDCMELIGGSQPSVIVPGSPNGVSSLCSPPSGIMQPPSPSSSSQRPHRSAHRSSRGASTQPSAPAIKDEPRSPDSGLPMLFKGVAPFDVGSGVSMSGVQGMSAMQQQQQQQLLLMQLQQNLCQQPGQQQVQDPFLLNGRLDPLKGLPSLAPLPQASDLPMPGLKSMPGGFQFQNAISSSNFTQGMDGFASLDRSSNQAAQGCSSDVLMAEAGHNNHSALTHSRMFLPADHTLTKSGRLRRMSADAASISQTPETLLPARTKGGSFSEAQTGKRSRTSAPDGLKNLGNDDEVDSLLGQGTQRFNLYHLESKGRHQPSRRTCEGRTSPINGSPLHLDNETDFSEIFSMLDESSDLHGKKGQADAQAAISPLVSPKRPFAQDPLTLHSSLSPFSPTQQQQGKPPRPPGARQPPQQHHHQLLQQQHQQHHHFNQAFVQQPQVPSHLAPGGQQLEQHQHQLQMQLQQAFAGIDGPACLSQGMVHAAPQQVKAPPPSPHDSSGTDTAGGSAQRTMSQRLSKSMRLNLRIHSDPALEEPEPLPHAFDHHHHHHQHEQHSDTACGPSRADAGAAMMCPDSEDNLGGAGSRVLQHSDSDSFNRTMNRVWHHSESDSFKSLLASLASPRDKDGHTVDPELDELLRNPGQQ